MSLSLRLLGGFEARRTSGAAVTLPTKKTQALLAYLALRPGQVHGRDALASLLWGDTDDAHARKSLRQAVYSLRKALPPARPPILVLERGTVGLNAAAIDVDVAELERLVAKGTADGLEQAAALYRGDLLHGFTLDEAPFEEWLLGERERLRELALGALAKLLAAQTKSGATEAGIRTAVRLLALDPLQEIVHRTLMRLYARQGRRGAALRQYQICMSVLRRELGAEPETETKQVYQEVLRQRASPAEKTGAVSAPASPSAVARPALPSAAELPAETMLVGRDAEMGRLRETLDEAARGHGRLVMVVGEAGIGKTTLLRWLAAEAGHRGARVLLGRSYESEQILPFAPWVDAFRTGQLVFDAEVLGTLAPVWRSELARLFPEVAGPGLPAASDDQRRLFESVVHLVERVTAVQPLALLLEDLHWADEMSVRLLSFLGRRIQAWPVLVVWTAREEELPDASALRVALDELRRDGHVAMVPLAPLSADDAATLVRSLTRAGGDPGAVARLEDQVWQVSEGNPFVIVETLRALGEGSISSASSASLSLPRSVRTVIAGRLDRLSDRARELAVVAAVIGREFEFPLLAGAAEVSEREAAEGLEELVRRRVLHGVGERFDFTHDRIREVVSSQLLRMRGKLLHASVGKALETLYVDTLDQHYAALGLHYREAESWEKAFTYLHAAGTQAAARSALQDARAWFEQALGAVEALPESQSTLEQAFDIRLELRPVLILLGDGRRALKLLREAETLAERLNDERRRGRVCAFMANIRAFFGELDEALASGARALAIARVLGDLELRVRTTTYLEQVHFLRGEYEQVVELATGNLATLPADWVYRHLGTAGTLASVYDRSWLIMSLAELGRFAAAAECEAEAIRLAEPTHHPYTVGLAYRAAGTLHLLKGDWAKARSLLEHGIVALRTGNVELVLSRLVVSSALVLAQLSETSEALNRLREGEQLIERLAARGIVGHGGWAYHSLGRTCLLLGRLDEAERLGVRAVESSLGQPGFAAHALHLRGDIATYPDQFDAESGEAHYRQALALAEPRGMRPLVAHCHLGLGELYTKIGKRLEAREELTMARNLYRAMEMTWWLGRADAALRGASEATHVAT